jgi:hypothetical protein
VAEKIRQKPLEFLCLMAGSFRPKTILTRASLHKKLFKIRRRGSLSRRRQADTAPVPTARRARSASTGTTSASSKNNSFSTADRTLRQWTTTSNSCRVSAEIRCRVACSSRLQICCQPGSRCGGIGAAASAHAPGTHAQSRCHPDQRSGSAGRLAQQPGEF